MKLIDWLFRSWRPPTREPDRFALLQECADEINRKVQRKAEAGVARELQRQIEVEMFGQPTSTGVNAPWAASVKPEDILGVINAYKQLFGQVNQPDLPGIETELDVWIREVEFVALARGFNLRDRGRAILPESLKPEGWHDCLCPAIGFAPDECCENNVYFFTAPEFDMDRWANYSNLAAPQPTAQGMISNA